MLLELACLGVVATVWGTSRLFRAARMCVDPLLEGPASRAQLGLSDKELAADGYFGRLTVIDLQALLQQAGCSPGPGPIDGHFGRRTTKALQAFLQCAGYAVGPIDGWMGRRTVAALQTWLRDQGASPGPIDGRWGRRTTLALQASLNQLRAQSVVDATPVPHGEPVDAESADPVGEPVPVVTGRPITPRTAAAGEAAGDALPATGLYPRMTPRVPVGTAYRAPLS